MKIAVGLSGGVDSAVAALLLKREGHDVIGLFMKNWEEGEAPGDCPSSHDFDDVSLIATHLQIPYYSVNFVKEYRELVFEPFLSDCKAGLTPNPDILCNREIKFHLFLNKAREFGADFLATGHYCRKENNHLLKGVDPEKDQSYFLYAIDPSALQSALFPIGHLCKQEVRAIAREAGLAVADKRDSTGICFIGERNFKSFLSPFLGFQKGPVLTLDGKQVGTHDGLAYHTIGQRKGLGLGGEGEPWYVVGKDLAQNAVIVERGKCHPSLYSNALIAEKLTWIGEAPTFPMSCSAKIRYRQKDTPCTLSLENGWLYVRFLTPQRAITCGQSVVFYQGERCLGGGIISERV